MKVRERKGDLEKRPTRKSEIEIAPTSGAEKTEGGMGGEVTGAGGPLVSSTCIGD